MSTLDSKVASFLLESGLLDKFQYQSVRDHQDTAGGRFHLLVIDMGYVREQQACAALAKVAKLPLVSLAKMQPDPKAIALMPGRFCKLHRVFPAALRDGGQTLWLAMADPIDPDQVRICAQTAGVRIRPLVGRPSEIDQYIDIHYAQEFETASPFDDGGIDLSLSDEEAEEEEFKVTDMSGNTLVKHVGDVSVEGRAALPKPKATSAPIPPPSVTPPALSIDERMARIAANQEKATRIIKGLVKLFVEKGFFSAEEFAERRRS